MKIGDKVRFLSEVGGGKISGFQGNNIVLVEDEDGFEIPTPINDVVVVGNDDMAKAKITKIEQAKDEKEEGNAKSIKAQLSDNTPTDTNKTGIDDEEEDYDPADKFVPQPREREGGNTLTAYLAFVPTKPREMNNTDFETYIVNDSNYYIHYLYMVGTKKPMAMQSSRRVRTQHKAVCRAVLIFRF